MAPDEIRARARYQRFQFLDHRAFHTADVGDNRTFFEAGKHVFGHFAHLPERGAKDDEIGILDGPPQAFRGGRGMVHDGRFARIRRC